MTIDDLQSERRRLQDAFLRVDAQRREAEQRARLLQDELLRLQGEDRLLARLIDASLPNGTVVPFHETEHD